MERIKATVIEIIFYNEENCYAVVGMEHPQMDFVAVGYLPHAEKGRTFVLEGEWKTNPKYGEQFAFTAFTEELPNTVEGIEAFLASGLLKGIGKKTAAAIVAHFGEDTLSIIENEPLRLAEISGISEKKAQNVSEAYRAHREFAQITVYFQKYGITPAYAMKLYKVYGSDTIKEVEENPYRMVDDIFGIGFKKADAIARQMGIAMDSEYRVRSGILYALGRFAEREGHTFYPQKEFCEKAAAFLEVSASDIYEMTVQMAFDGDVHLETLEGRSVIFPIRYWQAEQNVCAKLLVLNDSPLSHIADECEMERLIQSIEAETGIELSENQRFAVSSSLASGVSVITGGPGTGKTTILNTIMRIFDRRGISAAIAAPTGRAAKRITETSGYPASTVHRLLEYYYSEGGDGMRFGKTAEDPLDYQAVIVDEVSMVDILLMDGLLSALRPGTRLILVGDADQLPSVGAGNVLRDIIESEVIYSVQLTEIFRQAQESMIVVNAHRINRGEYPDCNVKEKDFFLLRQQNEKEVVATIKDLNLRRLPNFYQSDAVRDIQVMTPVRKGMLGTHQLNEELQQVLNPPSPEKREKKHGDRIFREGDKIMQIKNNYQLSYRRTDTMQEGEGVFNGDVGFIQSIDDENGQLYALFDDNKYVAYEFSQLDEVELAYAITVHKSQGSEFPIIIMPVSWFPPMLATRNLLYTAVTRAKDVVVLVGSEAHMRAMVDNNPIVQRYSGLKARLQRFLNSPL